MPDDLENFVRTLIATKHEIVDVEFYPSTVRVFLDRSIISTRIEEWLAAVGNIVKSRYNVGFVVDAYNGVQVPKFPDVAPGPNPVVPTVDGLKKYE